MRSQVETTLCVTCERLRALLSEHVTKVAVVIDVGMEEPYHPFLGVTARNVAFLGAIGAELRMGWRIRDSEGPEERTDPEGPEERTDPEGVVRDVRRRQELGDALWAWRRAGGT